MAQKDGSLIFDTKIDRKGFEDGVAALGTAGSKAFGAITKLVAGATTAIAGIGIASAKVGSDFEASMSQVAGTMGFSAAEIDAGSDSFKALEKAAMDAGAATKYSASESAEALNYLALAGYSVEDAVATLPKVLSLASAGGLDLAYASDLITDSASALGIELKDLDGFIDQMAKGAQKSNTSVGQLGEAILNIGGTAKILKGGTVELNTQLGILADNGIKGAEGGTALRNVLLSLSAPTDKQAKAMNALGIETYDANGNFRSTDDIFQDLNGTLGDMTEKKRTEALSDLFNKVDLKSANALLSGSGERFAELSNEIANANGTAKTMADTLEHNLKGKITILQSALEGVGIQIYKSMDAPLKDVVGTLEGYVNKIGQTITAHDDINASAEELGMTAEELGFDLASIPNGMEGAVEVIGDILADMISKVGEHAPMFMEMAVNLITSFLNGIKDNKQILVESAIQIVTTLLDAFFTLLPEIVILGMDLVMEFTRGMLEQLPMIIEKGQQMIMILVETIVENLPLILEMGMQLLFSLIEGIVEMLPELIPMAIELILSLVEALIDNIDLLIDASIAIVVAVAEGLIESLPILIEKAPIIINKLIDAIISNAGTLVKAAVELIFQLGAGLIGEIPNLVANIPEIVNAVLNAFTMGFEVIKEIGKNVIEGLWSGASSAKDWVVEKFKGVGTSIIDGVKGIFKIKSPSKVMADIGKNVVEGVSEGVDKNQNLTSKSMQGMSKGILAEFGNLKKDVLKALDSQFKDHIKAQDTHTKNLVDATNKANREELAELKKHHDQTIRNLIEHYKKVIDDLKAHHSNIITELKLNFGNQITELDLHHKNIITNLETHHKSIISDLETHFRNIITDLQTHHSNIVRETETHHSNIITEMEKQGLAIEDEDKKQHDARMILLEGQNDDLITLLESYYPAWYGVGETYGQNLIDGLESMKEAIADVVDDIASMIEDANASYEELNKINKDIEDAKNIVINDIGKGVDPVKNEIDNSRSIVQSVTFLNAKGTPSENARSIKDMGRELAYGY